MINVQWKVGHTPCHPPNECPYFQFSFSFSFFKIIFNCLLIVFFFSSLHYVFFLNLLPPLQNIGFFS
jgi:hypothetical protein